MDDIKNKEGEINPSKQKDLSKELDNINATLATILKPIPNINSVSAFDLVEHYKNLKVSAK